MPLGRFGRASLAYHNPAALGTLDQRASETARAREQFDVGRLEKRNEQVIAASLDILKRAPKGSRARALAVAALNNVGYGNNAIIQAIQESGPAPAKRTTKVVGNQLLDIPAEGAPTVLHTTPRQAPQPPSSSIERMISEVARTPAEAEQMKRAYIQTQSLPDPMRILMGQLLLGQGSSGVGGGAEPPPGALPGPLAPLDESVPLTELSPDEQATAQNARSAMEKGAPSEKIFERLKSELGWSRQKFNKYVLGR